MYVYIESRSGDIISACAIELGRRTVIIDNRMGHSARALKRRCAGCIL